MPAEYGSLNFAEATDFFRSKVNMPAERWADVWRDQHNLAFTVAGATKTDLLADMRKIVDSAIAEGKSLNWFQSQFKSLVKKHGWDHTGSAAWRANIIYDTNMRQSYNAGRYQQLQLFEYWRYKHGDSRYPRPHHKAKDGTILPKDSPFWRVWFPQNGWGCKCKVFGESARSLKRKGLKLSKEPMIETHEWTDKVTGEVHHVPVGIDPGFDYSPGKVDQATQLKKQLANRKPLEQRLVKRMIPSAFSTNKNVDVYGLNRILGKLAKTQPQLQKVSQFVQQYNIKTLFMRPSELGRGNKNVPSLREPIADYLGVSSHRSEQHWTVPSSLAKRANGYTAKSWKHVVVKAKSGINLDKIQNVQELADAVSTAIMAKQTGLEQWSLSHIVRTYADIEHHGGTVVTWLHELGHQVHFHAMDKGLNVAGLTTSITRYGSQDFMEWHAEHFAAWALNRELLVEHYPKIADYFDNLLKNLLDE